MVNTFFHLSTCNSCKKTMKSLSLPNSFNKINIKENPITKIQLKELYNYTKSYEKLINKRSQLYTKRKIKNIELKDNDFKHLLLEHYTFLKRPLMFYNNKLYIGDSEKIIEELQKDLNE